MLSKQNPMLKRSLQRWAPWRRRTRTDAPCEQHTPCLEQAVWTPLDGQGQCGRARALAENHLPEGTSSSNRLLKRMEANVASLKGAIRLAADAETVECTADEAAQWLIENEPLIREQAHTVRRSLGRRPRPEYPQVPTDAGGRIPRLYEIAWECVSHLDRPLDQEGIEAFVGAYQDVATLTLGELWSLPDMLRMALVEMLCHLAMQLVRQEQPPAALLFAIRNAISSLHAIEDVSWKELVESQSMVERVLRNDPSCIYPQMDFESRDICRRAVEEIASGASLSEEQVAGVAVDLARQARNSAIDPDNPPEPLEEPKQGHVGYYLTDCGRSLLESRAGYRATGRDALVRVVTRRPLACYLTAIAAVWLLGTGAAAAAALGCGLAAIAHPAVCVLLLIAFGGACTQFAVNVVHWLASLLIPPRPLVRMDFSKGIPAECRCLVAVPAMLTDRRAVRELVRQLEVRYLGNRDENLLFLLLTDFPDAKEQTLSGDRRLLDAACAEVERLNKRYGDDRHSIFYLLHRPRQWNPQQGVWMGEERKRGKLMDLNRLLRTGQRAAFQVTRGDLRQLSAVRYVITLDADTKLPPDAGRQLVACMAHPLNRPRIDPRTRMVVEGCAVLQPRVTVTLPAAHRSCFSRLSAGDAGLDPYTRYASNLYQDVFGQGSFIGKGIYDVQAFEAALHGRFPNNRILSHDLIEGCFTRSALVSDVELFEGVPSRLLADMSRRHRWIRGDWQIASWMFPRAPSAHGPAANPLPALARWKIFDNLRRSVMPIAVLLFVAVGWALAPQLAWLWTLLAAAVLLGPLVAGAAMGFVRKPEEKPTWLHLKDQWHACLDAMLFEGVGWCILPYAAHCHLDAIARTLYRLCFSQGNLLEWTTASDAEAHSRKSCGDHYKIMASCAAAGALMACSLAVADPWALWLAGPLLIGWLLGPAIAWRISQPSRPDRQALSDSQARQVGRWARQTWHYFERHVNQYGLPPDHVQEHPKPAVARLTSPTNIGMGLLADLAACDLGYLSAGALLDRTGRTLHTLTRLHRYRGHFYNWYDIDTLQVVAPRYVSSVDSGNLWGSLLAMRAGLEELQDREIVPPRLFQGLHDTVQVIAGLPLPDASSASIAAFRSRLTQLLLICAAAQPHSARRCLRRLRRVRDLAAELSPRVPSRDREIRQWTLALRRQCAAAHRELSVLAFWKHAARSKHPAVRRVLAPMQPRFEDLDDGCTLRQALPAAEKVIDRVDRMLRRMSHGAADNVARREVVAALKRLRDAAERAAVAVHEQSVRISRLTDGCRRMCAMDFDFLYDSRRKALSVGYNVTRQTRDKSHYDLLASESRLTSFLAISHGQIPKEHWHALGRMATLVGGKLGLLSWSGSMFEYLMPILIMPTHRATILDSACKAAVRGQIQYARRQRMPWGISESCHYRLAPDLRYQYQAFGVPELGLSPSLTKHLVAAPYASALAMMVAPREAAANLARLEGLGCLSRCGFFEAIDYGEADSETGAAPAICRTVMAHHSGMTLLAMAHCLLGGMMRRRFMADPRCEAYDMLLQERVPRVVRLADRPALANRKPPGVTRLLEEAATARLDDPLDLHLSSRESVAGGVRVKGQASGASNPIVSA